MAMRDYDDLVRALRTMSDWAGLEFFEESENVRCNLSEAADAIEELTTNCKQLPKWISVEDALPEIGVKVLVWYRWQGSEKHSIAIDLMGITSPYATEPHWLKHPAGKIRWWMPLPQPPKEDKP